jgi:hypothetical protein
MRRSTVIGLLALAVLGLGLSAAGQNSGAATGQHPQGSQYGSIIGYLDACSGLPPIPLESRYAYGKVTVLAGQIHWIAVGPGQWQESIPTTIVARTVVTPDLPFHFFLRAGRYVLRGNYGHGSNVFPTVSVAVGPGLTVHLNIPNQCR